MVLPIDKLLGLLVRQLSKPLASQIKSHAATRPRIRQTFVAFGQMWHQLEMQIKIRFLDRVPMSIKALPEDKAFQSGAEVFGELFVYTTAATVLLNEYNKSARKEAEKQRALNEAFNQIAEMVEGLQLRLDELEWDLRAVHDKVDGPDRPQTPPSPLPRLPGHYPQGAIAAVWHAVTGRGSTKAVTNPTADAATEAA